MEERIEVVDTVSKEDIDIIIDENDKFVISRIYNVSIPVNRIRYLEIVDAELRSEKEDINIPPFSVIAYTNLDGIEMVVLNEYNTAQDAFDAMSEYSRFIFNKRNMEE